MVDISGEKKEKFTNYRKDSLNSEVVLNNRIEKCQESQAH